MRPWFTLMVVKLGKYHVFNIINCCLVANERVDSILKSANAKTPKASSQFSL